MEGQHQPVLADQVTRFFAPALEAGGVFVDCTFGRGGHSRRIVEAYPAVTVVGIDRDPDAFPAGWSDLATARLRLVRGDFQDLEATLERLGVAPVRGVLFDLGVSSPQLDEPHRGFGYRRDGPLDMRMDPSQKMTAAQVVNDYGEAALARVISSYGQERFARRIARAIAAHRPIDTTQELAAIVRDAIPAATRRTGPHPARRTFQAIRIEVNHELEALERSLPQAVEVLEPGGRLAAISYHSLEDRIVKRFLASEQGDCTCPPDLPVCTCGARARVRVVTRRPVRPSAAEITGNPRASSAHLRVAERLGEAA